MPTGGAGMSGRSCPIAKLSVRQPHSSFPALMDMPENSGASPPWPRWAFRGISNSIPAMAGSLAGLDRVRMVFDTVWHIPKDPISLEDRRYVHFDRKNSRVSAACADPFGAIAKIRPPFKAQFPSLNRSLPRPGLVRNANATVATRIAAAYVLIGAALLRSLICPAVISKMIVDPGWEKPGGGLWADRAIRSWGHATQLVSARLVNCGAGLARHYFVAVQALTSA